MSFKNLINFAFVSALALLVSVNCAKTKDENTKFQYMLLFLFDQQSGNCADITKSNAGFYSATGYLVPKGGCNTSSFNGTVSTDATAAKVANDTFGAKVLEKLAIASCGEGIRSSYTSVKMTAMSASALSSLANISTNGCYTVVSGNFILCKDSASAISYSVSKHYRTVSDVYSDMSVSIAAQRLAVAALIGVTGFTTANSANAIVANSIHIGAASSAASSAYQYAVASVDSTCSKGIIAASANSDLKSYMTKVFGVSTTTFTGITVAEANSAIPIISASCAYGSSFTSPTLLTGVCPNSYPIF